MSYNILTYGAATANDARTNGLAIQNAINDAHMAGGGVVFVPAGTFVSTNIELKSNVNLTLDSGAVLFGSTDYNDYTMTQTAWPFAPMVGLPEIARDAKTTGFIYAINAKNISITGMGTIDGNGSDHRFPDDRDHLRRRPMLLFFDYCENIHIIDVTLKNSAMFALWASRSKRVFVRGVYIYSWNTENGDGLDFDGTSDVVISDCLIEAGDDGISLKTNYPDWANRNYTITNCLLRSIWAGIRIGPESAGDMSEIAISNCVFENCNDALKIQNCSCGRIENIRISGIVMRNVHRPLFMTASPFRLSRVLTNIRPRLGGLSDVYIDGLTAYMSPVSAAYQRNCFIVSGWKSMPIENLDMRNIKIVFCGACEPEALNRVDVPEFLDYSFMYADVFSINGDYPASGIYMRHVDGARFDNCQFKRDDEDARPLIFGYDLKDISMRMVNGKSAGYLVSAIDATIDLNECRQNGTPVERVEPFSDADTKRFREFERINAETDSLFEKMAAQVDAAQALDNYELIPRERWAHEGNRQCVEIFVEGGNVTLMLMLVSFGDGRLFVNGIPVAECVVPKLYRNMTAWAADITKLVNPGKNLVEIVWDEPGDVGGSKCLLPFGEFKELSVGLIEPMRVYYSK
ncbi:MAG: glycosyl hydrolase family 28 protein [Clostridia bacterium]